MADRRPPTADRRPPTADRRPPTADRRIVAWHDRLRHLIGRQVAAICATDRAITLALAQLRPEQRAHILWAPARKKGARRSL